LDDVVLAVGMEQPELPVAATVSDIDVSTEPRPQWFWQPPVAAEDRPQGFWRFEQPSSSGVGMQLASE
jgi:hypothetical protein